MSILKKPFVFKGKDGRKIVFLRPYLNDNKELVFIYCDQFSCFPNLMFVFHEKERVLELREKNVSRALVHIQEENEEFYQCALEAKSEIINLLRLYTVSLETGKEKVMVFETENESCPYYFVTHTILECGKHSIKFEKGMMYFLNKNKGLMVSDFMDMQALLSKKFIKVDKDKYRIQQDGNSYFEMTFGELLQIA